LGQRKQIRAVFRDGGPSGVRELERRVIIAQAFQESLMEIHSGSYCTSLLLVLPERKDTERRRLGEAWKEKGGEVLSLREFWRPPDLDRNRVRCYGGVAFCTTLAERWELKLVSPPEDLLIHLPRFWTKRDILLLPLSEIVKVKFPLFAKPLTIGWFKPGVFSTLDDVQILCGGLPSTTYALVSEVVHFEAEVRTFVLDRNILGCTLYHGTASLNEARAFAEEIVASADRLPSTVVVDIGLIRGRGWAIVEANPVWASALRGCSAEKILPCIARATTIMTEVRNERTGQPALS